MTIEVARSPDATWGPWTDLGRANIGVEYGLIELIFKDERGFGKSQFQVSIKPESFAVIARAMMHANSEEAIKAFGAALQAGIPEETRVWVPSMGG
jgi:hypothetical protein